MEEATIISGDSPQAAAILDIFTIVLIIAAIIFAIVFGLVITNIIRYRRGKSTGEPFRKFGNPKLEIVWTIIPAIILAVVFVITVRAMHRIQPPPKNYPPNMFVTANHW